MRKMETDYILLVTQNRNTNEELMIFNNNEHLFKQRHNIRWDVQKVADIAIYLLKLFLV